MHQFESDSLGLIAIPLGFWISALLIQTKTCFFWLFVAAFSVSYLSSGFFAIGEFNIAYAMVAFCASILLKEKHRKNWRRGPGSHCNHPCQVLRGNDFFRAIAFHNLYFPTFERHPRKQIF